MESSRRTKFYTPINKKIFMAVLKEKGKTILALDELKDENGDGICSERTIRRALDNGIIDTRILKKLGKALDLDPRYLAGDPELYPKMYSTKEDYLAEIQFYPYSRKEFDNAKRQYVKEWTRQLLPRFNISFSQFDDMSIVEQNELELKIVKAIMPIIRDTFKTDAFGDNKMNTMFQDVQEWENDLDQMYYAETVLRSQFLQNPPEGVSTEDITNMSSRELIALAFELQRIASDDNEESELAKEYNEKYPDTLT